MKTTIDSTQDSNQLNLAQLQLLQSLLASNQIGTWNLYIEGTVRRLQPDEKMRNIIGIPANSDMTEEEIAQMLESRIHPHDLNIFEEYTQKLMNGERTECTYRWNHPTKGITWMRCGGIIVSRNEKMMHLNGYHYDVTEQISKELRSNLIIKTFAQTYQFINYINIDDDTFYTYTEQEIEDETLIRVLMAGSATAALRIGLEEIVAEEYRARMATFTDFASINERMSHCNSLVTEFQDINGIWQELSFAVAERKKDGTIKTLLWAVRIIDNEKQIELHKQKVLEDTIAANKAKSNFLHNMSHEIRTPLNAMFGFAQLLGMPEGTNTEEEREQYNAYIYNSYQMLDMLIRDIIDVSENEQGKYRINLDDVAINEVCQNALRAVEFRVPAGVRAYYTTEVADDYRMHTDGYRIQQVLTNFLTNACKYTAQGEIHVHCSLSENPGKITFSVADTGTGIPASKAKVIFERFTKLNDYVQGTGLGLNICQTIANKLGGEVFLDTTYTTGARFVFVMGITPAS